MPLLIGQFVPVVDTEDIVGITFQATQAFSILKEHGKAKVEFCA